MLDLAQIDYIKYLRDKKGMDINAIAKEIKANWRTVKKYADKDNWNEDIKQRRKKTYPVLGPYLDTIDLWLMEDQRRPKKQRHTNTRIYHRLCEECGFKGGIRTVTEYVANRKKELMEVTEKETYIDLHHPGGEAQVDFGTAEVIYHQKGIQVKYLVMSFPYSNAAYLYVLPAENLECFLHGLQTLFEWAGGVPKRIWFDNLSAAVVKIKKGGKRQLTQLFQRFKLHYGFQATFCNPARGNEKGNVENKVGTVRRNWLVPQPTMISWEQINQVMKEKANTYLKSIHYEKKCPIQDLWDKEKQKLLFLPRDRFEAMRLKGTTLDKYGRFCWDHHFYKVPSGGAHDAVLVKVYWNRLEVLREDYVKIAEFTRPYLFKEKEIDWQAELSLLHKKPKALEYAWVYSLLPQKVQAFLNHPEMAIRKRRIDQLTKWLKEGYTIDHTDQALEETAVHLWDHQGVLYQALYRQVHPSLTFEVLSDKYTPETFKGYDPDLNAYNILVKQGAS